MKRVKFGNREPDSNNRQDNGQANARKALIYSIENAPATWRSQCYFNVVFA
jgi:hypothetical protein